MSSWYEWVFDGVGGAVAVAVGTFVYQWYSSRSDKLASVTASVMTNELNLTEPTPQQIIKEVDSALPFDRENAKEKYIGLSVVWQTSLLSLNQHQDRWFVVTRFGKGDTIITVCFSMSSVPRELSSATQYSTLLLKGRVRFGRFTSGVELEDDPEVHVIKRA
jgi:hypothetical protein